MRTLLNRLEASIDSAAGVSSSEPVMEYSEGGKSSEGQQQQYQQQRAPTTASYLLPPHQESRQPHQHRIQQQLWPQQQQAPPYGQHQQQPQPQNYSRHHSYSQTQDMMAVAAPPQHQALEHDYIAAQQQQSQQYMHHTTSFAAGGYNTRQQQQQYAQAQQQHLSYQQQLAMQQSLLASGAPQQPLLQQQQQQHHHNSLEQPQVQPLAHMPQPQPAVPYLQPKAGRLPSDRPLIKLSVSLIDTYKTINTVYYEERDARRAARAKEKAKKGQGANNNGWDDENYDYIVTAGELFYGRYRIKERIGKGSFGQVVRAEDTEEHKDVAIKIIKSKKPFLMQAKTEIELLTHLNEKDDDDQHNIGM